MSSDEDRIRGLPFWQGPVTLKPLSGGLTHTNLIVDDGAARYVARLGDDIRCHHVSREREAATSRAAQEAGISPDVVHFEPGLLIVRFVDARTYGEADVRDDLPRCIDLIIRTHRDTPKYLRGPAAVFWVFHVLRDYAHTLSDGNHPRAASIPEWLATAERLEAAQIPLSIVFGHHDLLPANFLNDGRRLWLIDWDYAGFGTAMFDLANLAVNNALLPGEETVLLESYFDRPPDEATRRAFDAMKVASGLREAMWGMVSELHLDVAGVDYPAHAAEFLSRYDAALKSYNERHGST